MRELSRTATTVTYDLGNGKRRIVVDPTWQVSASADDCVAYGDTSFSLISGFDWLAYPSSYMCCGTRFLNVTIPQGATIESAKVTFRANGSNSGTTTNRIKGQDADTTSTFSDRSDFNTRTRTDFYVDWSIPSFIADTNYDTPSIIGIIQEIVDRVSWASGNSLVLFFDDITLTEYRRAYSYDGSTTYCPILTVEYSTVGDWTYTEWQNGLTTDSLFDQAISGLEFETLYEFQAQARIQASQVEGVWSDSGEFTTGVAGTYVAINTSLSLTSSLDRDLASDRTVSPTLSLTSSITKGWGQIKATSSSLDLTTTISRALTTTRATSSSLGLISSLARAVGRTITTSSGLSLAVTLLKTWGHIITTSSGLTLATTVSKVMGFVRAASSALSLAVTIARSGAQYLIQTTSNLSLTISLSKITASVRAMTSNLSLTPTISRATTFTRATASELKLTVIIWLLTVEELLRVIVATGRLYSLRVIEGKTYGLKTLATKIYKLIVKEGE